MVEEPIQVPSFDREPGKPPWKPRVAGVMVLLLGPLAGAFITYVNFKRLGQERKATLTLAWSIPAVLGIIVALIYLPDSLTRIVGLCVEGAGVAGYPAIQKDDFALWEKNHPQVQPASGWRSLGLAFLGLVAFFGLAIGIGFGQSKLEEVHINRANQLLDQKRFEEARKEYELAARIDPNDPVPHLGMGDSFTGEQKWEEAGREYKIACGMKSDSVDIEGICKSWVK
jgi:tetratricopeptide (TPR) repeat protein